MELNVIQIPILIFLASLFIFLFSFRSKLKTLTSSSVGFKSYPIVGSLPEFILNRHRFLEWSTEVLLTCPTYTAVFHRPGKVKGIMTANPLNVEYMLKTNFENFPKGATFISLLEDFLGTGIFNSDGETWKLQRKIASHEFSTKSLRNFVMECVSVEIQKRLVPLLQNAAQSNKILDMQDILERFGFDNICKVAFNVDPCCLGAEAKHEEFMKAFDEASIIISGRFMYVLQQFYKIKKFFNLGSEHKLQKTIQIVHEFADKIIRSRLQETKLNKDEDLLSRFIDDSKNSAQYLRYIVISFILAGRDTTSSALSWFFWILSSRPDVVEKILQELQNIRAKNKIQTIAENTNSTYTFNQLREMNYLHAAISESIRLYSPVPTDSKTCLHDDIFPDGTFVGKNWFITYSTYAMGRMENLWGEDCREYKPERWIDENGVYKPESPFKFPAFHAGPRMCLGKDMAYIQMKCIAATVIERFQMELVDKEKWPEHLLSLTLKMKGGLLIRFKDRK